MLMCTDLLKTSAAMGTVELTGLEMMATQAPGQYLATPAHRFATMPARGACTAQPRSTLVGSTVKSLPGCLKALLRSSKSW